MSEQTNKPRWELSGDLIIDRREKVYVAQLTEPGSRSPSPLEIDSKRWLLASRLAKELVSAANARDALLAACEAALPDVEHRLDCERSAVDNMSPELVRLYDLQGKLARAIAEATGAWPRHRKE